MTMADCLMHIIAFYKEEREEWKRISMLTFTIGRYGNSDPKSFPQSIQKYMPSLWDEEGEDQEDRLLAAARFFRQHQHINGLNGRAN